MHPKPSTPDRKPLAFDPERSRHRPPGVVKREPLVERILCVLVGSSIALGFGTAAWFLLTQREPAIWIAALLPGIPVLFLGTFGLSWVIQGLRGRSRHEGLFYWLLGRLLRLGPRPWALYIPVLSLAGVLIAFLTDDPKGLELALRTLLFWLVLMTHIAAHEVGHVIAARIAKLEVRRVIVGPFEFTRAPTWRPHLSREWLSLAGGLVGLAPHATPPPPGKLLVFALGGPIATALVLVLFLAASPYDLVTLATESGPLRQSVFTTGVMLALFVLIVSLWPVRQLVVGIPSDGYQIIGALRAIMRDRTA